MDSPSAPDTTKADANAARMVELNEEQFAWVKQKYEEAAPDRAEATRRAYEASDLQLEQARKSGALADESASDYRRIYRPAEEAAAKEAESFNSEARREKAAGEAVAGVTQAFSGVRDSQQRNMASMGINVNDGAYASTNAQLDATEALGAAGAANRARSAIETQGRAMRNDVIATGRGQVSAQGTQAGMAVNAGSAGAATGAMPTAVGQQGAGMVTQAAGQATSGLGAAANIYNNSSKLQYAHESGAANSNNAGMASLAGAAMTAAAVF